MLAEIEYSPAVPLAVNGAAVATPFASVVTVVAVVLLAKAPLAPLAGALKVTTTPLTGLLLRSVTFACSAVAKV
jgi:hypothetical protein